MTTKSLLALALTAAGMSLAVAQNSQNVVGYINVTVTPGLSMIANQLNLADNTVAKVIPTAPTGATLYKFNNGRFVLNTIVDNEWDDPAMTLAPGEGAFILNPNTTAFTLTFIGEVKQGASTVALPKGLSIFSVVVPQALSVVDLVKTAGFPAADGDTLYDFSAGKFSLNTYVEPDWDVATQTLAVGKSYFFNNVGNAKSWARTFNVQ